MSNTPELKQSSMNTYDADQEQLSMDRKALTPPRNWLTRIKEDVDPKEATAPLTAYCFMTGFMCVSAIAIEMRTSKLTSSVVVQ